KVKDVIYMGTDVGGVFRFQPVTQTWIPITDGFTKANYYSGESIALDPEDTTGDVVYIAAGRMTSSPDCDVFRSTDRGRTWIATNITSAGVTGMGGSDTGW